MQPDDVPRGLRVAAAYSWRFLVIGAVIYFAIDCSRLEFVAIALFIGLVITALVGPLVRLLHKVMPRGLAVAIGLFVSILVILGIFTFIGAEVAGQIPTLSGQFRSGIDEIERWLREAAALGRRPDRAVHQRDPHLDHQQPGVAGRTRDRRRGDDCGGAHGAVPGALLGDLLPGRGERIWDWILTLVSASAAALVDGAGLVAWGTFAGYTRGSWWWRRPTPCLWRSA